MNDDTISRQKAIDELNVSAELLKRALDDTDLVGAEREKFEWGLGLIESCISDIEDLPSATRWIPCEERTPKIDMSYPHHEDYLVQYDSGDMDVASWSNANRFWTDYVTEPYWNCAQFAKVIAWMPLPEPWKGEEE